MPSPPPPPPSPLRRPPALAAILGLVGLERVDELLEAACGGARGPLGVFVGLEGLANAAAASSIASTGPFQGQGEDRGAFQLLGELGRSRP